MDTLKFRRQLRGAGWNVVEADVATFVLPAAIAKRFPRLPATLVRFLSGLVTCSDSTDTTWFLCQLDYEGASDSAYAWDEWEIQSLECAEGDSALVGQIRNFWDVHFPFMFSVRSGYTYWAVRTTDTGFGQIVVGHEPEFEEALVVAESFEDFLAGLLQSSSTAS